MRRYGQQYQHRHRLSRSQRKALRAIRHCRTPALGGHREFCEECGFESYRYHSCCNRHCPKCQTQRRDAWLQARKAELLPVPYFHQVFTLPHRLHPLVVFSERNQRALLKLLFDAAAQTLLSSGRHTFGGTVGFTLVLHTWDQQLRLHLHLHCLIASGALLTGKKTQWVAGGRKFLFPVHRLSKMFRATFLHGLAKLLADHALDLPPSLLWLESADSHQLCEWLPAPWVVYSKAPFAGPAKLLDYLGRYTHRVAISNNRLLSCKDGFVRFTWRDRRDGERIKAARLPAEEFLSRFLKHVLPSGFQRIRHYGLLANRGKRERLDQCRRLLGAQPLPVSEPRSPSLADWLNDVLGIDAHRCPSCGGPLRRQELEPEPDYSSVAACARDRPLWDTS